MKRRIIAAVAAVILAGVAAFGLVTYVQGADARALVGQEPVKVLVVTKSVPYGTTTENMTKSVETKLLPRTAVAPGAVTSLDEIGNTLVTTAVLQVGEQVLTTRFADPATLIDAHSAPVPKGLHELSLQLESQRVLGANMVPGDTVGVFLTVGQEPNRKTHLVAGKVLVSRIQGGLPPAPADDAPADETAPMPEESVMVTLAVTAAQAEKIVYAAEDGDVWLSLETADDNEDGTKITNEGNALQ